MGDAVGDGLVDAMGDEQAPLAEDGVFPVGHSVRLKGSVPYLKTADPMPMLRPPDLVDPEETGVVVECRALGILAVRFRRGTFLLEQSRLTGSASEPTDPG